MEIRLRLQKYRNSLKILFGFSNLIISFARQTVFCEYLVCHHPETRTSEAEHWNPALTNKPANRHTLKDFTNLPANSVRQKKK